MTDATPPKRASFTIGGGNANDDADFPRRRDPGLRLTQLDGDADADAIILPVAFRCAAFVPSQDDI
ncbi:unnamed protein product, partial [Tilletia laevis]